MTRSKLLSRFGLLIVTLWLCSVPGIAEEPTLEFRASDKSFTISTVDDFRATYNPHAVLSLASLDEIAVVVTKRKAESSVAQLYDSFPKSLPADYPCLGRMMLSVDQKQAASFVLEGMFPPQGEPTHQTLLTIAVHDGQEYNFMIHYPLENEKQGLETAYAIMTSLRWSSELNEELQEPDS